MNRCDVFRQHDVTDGHKIKALWALVMRLFCCRSTLKINLSVTLTEINLFRKCYHDNDLCTI